MDYKAKYERALNIAKCLYEQRDFEWSDKDIEQIFPELKESDDEKTRGELIERLKWELNGAEQQDAAGCSRQKDIEMFKRGIAWLEKQKPIKWTSEDEANMDAVWKACGQVYGIKYQGILGDWLKTLRPHENKDNKEGYIDLTIAAIEEYYGDNNPLTGELVSWLEKQDGQNLNNQFTAEQVNVLDKHIDKFFEQKSIDESEPKFKVGDWVIVQDKIPCQIEKVTELPHNHYQYWTTDEHWFGDATVVRLWIIQDAKDGDVLVYGDDKRPFIFKGLLDIFHPECPVAYCGIDSTGTFSVSTAVGWWTDKEVQPATKEQCDLLFQKMKEAGYEWDAEKKKLKKVEQESTWSEEDENTMLVIKDIIRHSEKIDKNIYTKGVKNELLDWLKSLRFQKQWKPTKEQIETLEFAASYVDSKEDKSVYNSIKLLIDELERLM